MGYTHYHKFRSEGKEELVNQFYRRVLQSIRAEGKTLLDLFKLDKDNNLTEEADNYFHEYARDRKGKNKEISIDTDPKRGFTKTARKKYDIAVLLTYLFDDLLSGGDCKTDGDYGEITEGYVEAILEGMIELNDSQIKTGLRRYIKEELSDEEYTTDEIDDVVNSVMIYCEENELSELEKEELYNEQNPDPDDTDLEHIGELVKQGYTSGEWRNGGREITFNS